MQSREERPRRRRQFVQAAPHDAGGQLLCLAQVLRVGFDVLHHLAPMLAAFDRLLELAQERNGPDEAKVFLVVAAQAQAVAWKAQRLGERDDYFQRSQQPLRGVMGRHHGLLVEPGEQAPERFALALGVVDALRLLAVLVHGEDQKAVGQFLVELGLRAGHELRHRAFHGF